LRRHASVSPGRRSKRKEIAVSFLSDFKAFAFKGNAIDLAVGVVIGAAFGKIVSALVADLIMPTVALVMPSGDWRTNGLIIHQATDPKDNVVIKWGDLLGNVLDFFIVSLVLFVLVSVLVKKAEGRLVKAAAPVTKPCPFCLETVPLAATRCKACTSTLSPS
jgi:large conductance mechanosensitive channel